MDPDEDPQDVLSALEAEQREILGEADALRRFIACMRTLIDATRPRQDISEMYGVLEHVLDNAIRAVDARDGSVLVPDRRTRELVFMIVRGDNPNSELIGRRLAQGEGIAGWVAETRRAAIVNNASADARFFPGLDRELHYKTHSILAAPLVGAGRMLGVVEVLNKRDGKFFSVSNKTLLSLMCRFAGEMLYAMVRDQDLSGTDQSHGAARIGP